MQNHASNGSSSTASRSYRSSKFESLSADGQRSRSRVHSKENVAAELLPSGKPKLTGRRSDILKGDEEKVLDEGQSAQKLRRWISAARSFEQLTNSLISLIQERNETFDSDLSVEARREYQQLGNLLEEVKEQQQSLFRALEGIDVTPQAQHNLPFTAVGDAVSSRSQTHTSISVVANASDSVRTNFGSSTDFEHVRLVEELAVDELHLTVEPVDSKERRASEPIPELHSAETIASRTRRLRRATTMPVPVRVQVFTDYYFPKMDLHKQIGQYRRGLRVARYAHCDLSRRKLERHWGLTQAQYQEFVQQEVRRCKIYSFFGELPSPQETQRLIDEAERVRSENIDFQLRWWRDHGDTISCEQAGERRNSFESMLRTRQHREDRKAEDKARREAFQHGDIPTLSTSNASHTISAEQPSITKEERILGHHKDKLTYFAKYFKSTHVLGELPQDISLRNIGNPSRSTDSAPVVGTARAPRFYTRRYSEPSMVQHPHPHRSSIKQGQCAADV